MSLLTAKDAEVAPARATQPARVIAAARAHARMLTMLVLLALAQGVLYAIITPPWQAPDETGHFEFAWTMAQLGRIPTPADASPQFERAFIDTLYQYRFGDYIHRSLPDVKPARLADMPAAIHPVRTRTLLFGRFSLSYLPPALAIGLAPQADLISLLYLARLTSVLLTAVFAVVLYQTCRLIRPDDWRLNGVVVAFALLIPQHGFINASVTDGTLAQLCAAVAIYGWVRLFARGADWPAAAAVLAGTLLGLFAKATTAFLLPAGGVLAIWWVATRTNWLRSRAGVGLALAALAALALVLWASPFAVRIAEWLDSAAPHLVWRDSNGVSFARGLLITYHTFWASFGWLILSVSPGWYLAIEIVSLVALAGWLFGRPTMPRETALVLWLLLLTAVAVFSYGGLLTQPEYWVQGRYLFPAMSAFAILFVHGIARLVPLRRRVAGFAAILVPLIVFNVWCILEYIVPFFYT